MTFQPSGSKFPTKFTVSDVRTRSFLFKYVITLESIFSFRNQPRVQCVVRAVKLCTKMLRLLLTLPNACANTSRVTSESYEPISCSGLLSLIRLLAYIGCALHQQTAKELLLVAGEIAKFFALEGLKNSSWYCWSDNVSNKLREYSRIGYRSGFRSYTSDMMMVGAFISFHLCFKNFCNFVLCRIYSNRFSANRPLDKV
jgi:hypothetical protein